MQLYKSAHAVSLELLAMYKCLLHCFNVVLEMIRDSAYTMRWFCQ